MLMRAEEMARRIRELESKTKGLEEIVARLTDALASSHALVSELAIMASHRPVYDLGYPDHDRAEEAQVLLKEHLGWLASEGVTKGKFPKVRRQVGPHEHFQQLAKATLPKVKAAAPLRKPRDDSRSRERRSAEPYLRLVEDDDPKVPEPES